MQPRNVTGRRKAPWESLSHTAGRGDPWWLVLLGGNGKNIDEKKQTYKMCAFNHRNDVFSPNDPVRTTTHHSA